MEILINTPGTKLRKDGENLFIENKREKKRVPLKELQTILLGERVSITTSSLVLLMKNQVSIFLVDWKNEVIGEMSDMSKRSKGKTLINQLHISKDSKGLELSKGWIIEKLQRSEEHLKYIGGDKESIEEIHMIEELIREEENREVIRGHEGRAGRVYFKELRKLSCSEEKINTRNIKPARDSFNISLNYTYGILYRKLEKLFVVNKLEPTIGFFHTNESNKNSLVFDFIERYRIIFLRRVYKLFCEGTLSTEIFTLCEGKYLINDKIKKLLVAEFNDVLKRRYGKESNMTLEDKIKKDVKNLREEIDGFSSL